MIFIWRGKFGRGRTGAFLAFILLTQTFFGSGNALGGTVAAWGWGNYGQTNVPRDLTNITAIACALASAVALREDSTVAAWGAITNVPAGLSNVVAISAGSYHFLALKRDGSVVAWGDNTYGQTNVPTNLNHCVALGTSTGNTSLAIQDGGRVAVWGRPTDHGPQEVPPGLSNVVAVSGTEFSALALKSDGTLRIWGAPFTNVIAGLSNVVMIRGAYESGIALSAEGNVTAWQGLGRVTVPAQATGAVAISINLALKSDGTLVAWGSNTHGQTNVPAYVTNVVAIESSGGYGAALMNDGTPVVLHQPNDVAVMDGVGAEFRVIAVGPAIQYQWQWNGSDIAYATNAVLQLTNCNQSQVGAYSVTVRNSIGSVQSKAAQLNVNSSPPTFLSQPVGQLIFPGSNATLSATATGPLPIAYQWQFNGTPITGATNSTLILTNLTFAREGQYALAASNRFGVSLSSNAYVNVVGLDDALNAPQLSWTTNGNTPWQVETNLTHDGFAAISSGPFVYGTGQATLQTIVVGPGRLSFWYYPSNYGSSPPLSFLVDGLSASSISSTRSWNQVVVYLADGVHQLSWVGTYRDMMIQGLSPSITLDQVLYTPGLVPVSISSHPRSQTVSAGSTVSFSVSADGTPGLGYQWTFNNVDIAGATNASLSLTDAQDQQAGLYSVRVSNVVGQLTSSNAMLTVNSAPPSLTQALAGQSATVGDLVVFSAKFSGSEPIAAQWFFNSNAIPDATNATLVISNVQLASIGNYSIALTNAFGSTVSSNANLDVHVAVPFQGVVPVITTQPLAQTIAAGQKATLTVAASGTAPLHYQWQMNGSDLSGAITASLVLTNNQIENQGDYSVVVTNDYGVAFSSIATLTVTSSPPAIVSQPADNLSTPQNRAQFVVTATGSLPISYQWFCNGNPVKAATNAILSLPSLEPADQGGYSAVITNAFGSVTSRIAQLTFATSVVADDLFWIGKYNKMIMPANLLAIAAGDYHGLALRNDGTVLAWADPVWARENQAVVPDGLSNVVAIAAGAGHSIALKGDGTVVGWGSASSGEILTPPSLTNTIAISTSSAHNLALRSDGSLVSWGEPPTRLLRLPTNPGPYVAIGTGEFNDSAITAQGSAVFWGQNGETEYIPENPSGAAAETATGASGRWVLSQDGVATFWSYDGKNQFSLSNIVTLCAEENKYAYVDFAITLSNDGTLSEYGSLYTIPSMVDHLGNVATIAASSLQFMALQNSGTPFVARQPLNRTVASGAPVMLSVGATGIPPLSYQWQFNGANLDGATNACLLLANTSASAAGAYQCIVTNSLGNALSVPAQLTVKSPPTFDPAPHFVDRNLKLHARGFTGHGAVILFKSTNLADWTGIQTNPPTTDALDFNVPADNTNSAVFYRLLEQ